MVEKVRRQAHPLRQSLPVDFYRKSFNAMRIGTDADAGSGFTGFLPYNPMTRRDRAWPDRRFPAAGIAQ